MMARTNIQVFNAGYQNIMDDDNYNVNVQRTRGVTAGIADPLLHNKLYRQTSIMAKALADYIVSQGQDCLDTDLNAITNAFTKALETHTRKNTGVLVTESKTAVNTADWNTLTESRTYKITGATFAADKHQPVGAIGTGELVVLKNGDDTIVQVYYANSAAYDKAGAYHRMCISGTWTDWVYNITNKGGTVTGDFKINGKLTVNEVQVTDKLLIGEVDPSKPDNSNFLTKDDLQKLQDQIIAPETVIYVDQKNGNDSNDGKTLATAFASLDKAFSSLRSNIPTVTINLQTYSGVSNSRYNTFYLSEPINNDVLKIGTLRLIGDYTVYRTEKIVAKIVVPYGKASTGVIDYSVTPNKEYYQWGNMFIINCTGIVLRSVIFEFPEETSSDEENYCNSVFHKFSGSFDMTAYNSNTLTLPQNCHLFNLNNSNNVDVINFSLGEFTNGTITGDDLLITARTSNIFKEDPLVNGTNNSSAGNNIGGVINKYLKANGLFTGSVLGSTKGLPSNVKAIYTSGFD